MCLAAGLTGTQGVVVPAANARHLMLRQDVVEAAARDAFHVWAIDTVDEGLELLTGVAAGEQAPDGSYPEGTIHRRVADRLARGAEIGRAFRAGDGTAGAGE